MMKKILTAGNFRCSRLINIIIVVSVVLSTSWNLIFSKLQFSRKFGVHFKFDLDNLYTMSN